MSLSVRVSVQSRLLYIGHVNCQAYLYSSPCLCNPSSTGTWGSHGDQVGELLQGLQPFYVTKWVDCNSVNEWATDFD